jgi:hypothetical protein
VLKSLAIFGQLGSGPLEFSSLPQSRKAPDCRHQGGKEHLAILIVAEDLLEIRSEPGAVSMKL